MNKALFLFFLFAVLACTRTPNIPAPQGQHVGNGGDLLPKLFERARSHAVKMLDQVTEIPSGKKDWYVANRVALIQDVQQTPAYVWVASNSNSACGMTADFRRAPIYLSYEHCRGIRSLRDAALHLIGESIHHFGISDDAFSAAIAVEVGVAWDLKVGSTGSALEKRLLFEQGRIHAHEVMLRLQEENIPLAFRAVFPKDQRDWLIAQRGAIADEVSKSPHLWVDGELSLGSNPDETCFFTSNEKRSTIELSYTGCEKVERREKAGQLLLEASLSHLQSDKEIAKRLAALAYAIWFNMGHPESAHWLTIPPHSNNQFDVYEAAWTGDQFFVWSQYLHSVFFYHPRTNQWEARTAKNAGVHPFRKGQSPQWIGSKLLIFDECYKEAIRGSGVFYDSITNRWDLMTKKNGPEARWFGTTASGVANGKLFIFGGINECALPPNEKKTLYPLDFALYDPAQDLWTKHSVSDDSHLARDGQVVINTGSSLLVWGGRNFSEEENNFVVHNDGGFYDFSGRLIKKISMENAPKGRAWAKAVFGERYLVILGGYSEGDSLGRAYRRSFIPDGAIYDLKEDKWSPMDFKNAPNLDAGLPFQLVWIGNEVLFIGNAVAYYNPIRNSWHSSSRAFAPLLQDPYRIGPKIFWTGMEAILWDAASYGEMLSGYAYYP